MEVLGLLWVPIVALPSGILALLGAGIVIREVRQPFRTTGRLAVFLRVVIGLAVGAIVFFAAFFGGLIMATGPF